MSVFADTAKKITNSAFIIPVFLAVIVGIVIGCFAFYEDYQSSLHGYAMLPTRKSGEEIMKAIALLPQVGQIIFFYMFGQTAEILPNGRRRINYLYFVIAFFLLLFDLGTDMYFKASGLGVGVWFIAFVESITIFTIGSEMLLTASAGLFLELLPKVFEQLGDFAARIASLGQDDDNGGRPDVAPRR